jgi:nucleotide-binding universal stress UspA family protein
MRDAAAAELEQVTQPLKAAGIRVQEHLADEYPSLAICQSAKDLEADVIVMGTKGTSGLKHVLLGSVAERTLRIAPCPVLTVGEDHD